MDDIFNRIVDKTTLYSAWQLVKAKGKAGGIDSISTEKFELNADKYIDLLYSQLHEDIYVPEPYQTFKIPKNDKEFRKLGLPAIKDKIVQVAAKEVISPLYEKQFLNVSYGYRNGKGPLRAINRIRYRISNEKRKWVTIADIDNFFDTIQPEILYELIEKQVRSPRLMKLIKLWVQMGSFNYRQKYEPYSEGIPQGCILSPLFSNIYLHQFDCFMVEKNYGLVRYADDFVILSNSEIEAQNAYRDAKNFLEQTLHLKLNENWSVKKVKKGFEFLHILFRNNSLGIGEGNYKRLTQKLEDGIDLSEPAMGINKLSKVVNGIKAYYGMILPESMLEKLDAFLCKSLASKLSIRIQSGGVIDKHSLNELLYGIVFFSKSFLKNRTAHIKEIKKGAKTIKPEKKISKHDKQLKKIIEKKRDQYLKLARKNTELIIAATGVFLGKNYKGVTVKEFGEKKHTFPSNTLKAITLLSENISLSGKLISWCSQNNVSIDFIGFNGLPYAKIITPNSFDAALAMAQIESLEDKRGRALTKKIVSGKIKNQIGLVKYYHKYRKTRDPEYAKEFKQRIVQMERTLVNIKEEKAPDLKTLRTTIMGYEGHASACYWDMVIKLLDEYIVFENRNRQGATDLVNCMLNYGYGILYSRVWQAISRVHLNPCISYLHAPNKNKPTLAFDLIEEFRQQAVDKVVFALITKKENMQVAKGVLTPDTKKRLAKKVLERLNKIEKFRGESLTLAGIIDKQANLMVQHILGKKKYKPYVAKW